MFDKASCVLKRSKLEKRGNFIQSSVPLLLKVKLWFQIFYSGNIDVKDELPSGKQVVENIESITSRKFEHQFHRLRNED